MTPAFLAKYGNPDADGDAILDPAWFAQNIRIFTLPYELELSWQPGTMISRFQAHRLAGDRIASAYARILETAPVEDDLPGMLPDARDRFEEQLKANPGAVKLAYLRAKRYDQWGGCFAFRPARGRDFLSMHCWGIAVDHCPELGRLGNLEDAVSYPAFIARAFEAEGFYWGRHFARPDSMHFELQS
jgi:hypothetical protein